jgi:hypothetical protein
MDHPRLSPTGDMKHKRKQTSSKEVRTFEQIMMEHNRQPGVFDYNYG